ncbi:hypothetical protein DFH09DRAFT_263851 [Mycena vulgaris]|nr:hypothetical protein DFH09DRAFT_263851 [Mycena vulgaris]
MDANTVPEPNGALPIQDTNYFFDDGDCVFLVEGYLFKLHKSILSRDPESMFRGMFSIPQGRDAIQSADPILTGDSAEEFRALCWVVYALPNEILLQNTPNADIPRLVGAAKMCHKYNLSAFESWALDMIRTQCASNMDYLSKCSTEMLSHLMALALRSGDITLLAIVEGNWMARIEDGLPCNSALAAGEEHGRRRFLADVYYHLNTQLYVSTLSPANAFTQFHLTETQLLHLLSGHALLSNFWYQFRRGPLPAQNSCSRHHTCTQIWGRISWLPEGNSDVMKSLKAAQEHVVSVGYGEVCPGLHLGQAIANFDVTAYFLGPEATV